MTETLVGAGPLMQAVFKRIAFVAPTPASVLVTGECGTETCAVARAIHTHSTRNHGPFVTFHAADRSPDDIEAALFGHAAEPGNGDGLLVGAAGGTMFLGEVTDLPFTAQAKLLGVIDRHEVTPVGGFVPNRADVRLIVSIANPAAAITSGRLRRDIADRLGVYPIALPPLRDRIEDVPALAEAALRSLGVVNAPARLTPDALVALQARPWPGNVRELRDALAHALSRAGDGPIGADHLPRPAEWSGAAGRLRACVVEWVRARTAGREGEPSGLYGELLAAAEPALLAEVLSQLGGRRLPAARWLGVSRVTLRKSIRAHRLDTGITAGE